MGFRAAASDEITVSTMRPMTVSNSEDPYGKFEDDNQRCIAMISRDKYLAVIAAIRSIKWPCMAAMAYAPNIDWKGLTALLKWFH